MVAVLGERQQCNRLRRHARCRGQRRAAALQRGHALFEGAHGGVGDARVDVAERLQIEQTRRVVGAVEHERGRLVDRQRARAGRPVRDLPRVQAERVEAVVAVRHRR